MKHLVFLLEEPSARDLLQGFLPQVLPDWVQAHYLVFEGKQDLEKQLVKKMRGWLRQPSAFVILRDQDAGDCRTVKRTLVALSDESGRAPSLVRIACRELESWLLGDWQAVAQAFERPRLADLRRKREYQDPDKLVRPVEMLRRHIPEYQKRDGARRVGPFLDPRRNTSRSFAAFCTGLSRIVVDLDAMNV